jgi:hypothetical protein
MIELMSSESPSVRSAASLLLARLVREGTLQFDLQMDFNMNRRDS